MSMIKLHSANMTRVNLHFIVFLQNQPPEFLLVPTVPKWCFFCGSFLLFIFHVCLCFAFLSVRCGLVFTCWKRVDLLVFFCVMFACVLSLSHMVSRVGRVDSYVSYVTKYPNISFTTVSKKVDNFPRKSAG